MPQPASHQSPAPKPMVENPKAETSKAGPLFMVSAALLFTLMSTLVKLLPEGYTVLHIGFVRCFGGLIILVSFFSRGKNPYAGHNIPLLIFRGCTGSMAFFLVVTALRNLPMSTAVVLFYSYPVFAAVFGLVIYREGISLIQVFCMGILVAGVAVLFDFSLTGSTMAQAMAIGGAVFAGLTVTLIRSLRKGNGPVVIYLYFCTMGTLLTLPYVATHPMLPASPLEWLMLAGIALISVGAQLAMNQGFFYCKGFEGAAYMSTETVFTAVVGILCLNDPVSWRFFAGALLILGSGLMLNFVSAGGKKG